MSYLYQSNLDPTNRFDKLEFQLDNGDTAVIQKGYYYDLTAGELSRARQYVVLVSSAAPANAAPVGIVELPVEGDPSNGDVPIWSSSVAAFVPGPMTGGGGGSGIATVQDEGSNLTQRTKLNFIGAGVTAADNAGTSATDVTIPATGAAPRIVGAMATNLGAAQTITFTGAEEVWLLGTLNANLTITLAGRTAGARLLFIGLQDGTGGRTVTVSDGSSSQALTGLPTTAGALDLARAFCPNSIDIDCEVPAGGTAADASTSVKGVTLLSVAPVSSTSPIAVGDNDTRMTNSRAPSGTAGGALSGSYPNPALADETVNTVASSGGAQTIPAPQTASISRITLSANCTLTFPAAAAGRSFTVVLVQDATGGRTVTWPTVLWPGGTTPTLTATAAKRDVFTFLCVDGTNWLGLVAGQNL